MRPRNHLVPVPGRLRGDGTVHVGHPRARTLQLLRLVGQRLPPERNALRDLGYL